MHRGFLSLSLSFSLALSLPGCSLFKKATGRNGGGKAFSETFTEAPTYELGKSFEVKGPPCNGTGFIKLDVEPDQPFYFTTTAAQAGNSCAYVEVVNGRAQAANTPGASADVCAESGPRTIESKGQEGGTFITLSERYGCAGIAVKLDVQKGTAPASTAAEAASADGPTPEN